MNNDFAKLQEAVTRLYMAAYWSADRDVDEVGLWTAARDAVGIKPGSSPKKILLQGEQNENTILG